MPIDAADFGLMRIAILILAVFAVYRSRQGLSALLIITAVLSALSFTNFGSFHLPLKEKIHYWDAYHYYSGAKYFKELGYSGQYNATYIAGKELGYFNEVTAVRDLNSYKIIPVSLLDPEKIKSRFSTDRWKEFIKDIDFFYTQSARPDSAWQKLLVDHGYNAPPLKTAVMAILLNLFPLNETTLNLTVFIDYLLILALIAAIALMLSPYAACLFTIAFCLNPVAPFDFTFGSIMRYDWFFALGLGLCFLLKENYKAAGVMIALSAHCRIFPLLFALGIILMLTKKPKDLLCFSGYFAAACGIGTLIAFLYLPDPYFFSDFLSKMSVHRDQVYSNTVGLKPFFLSDIVLNYYANSAYSEAEIANIIGGRKFISNLFGIVISLVAVFISSGKRPIYGFLCGAVLVFVLINPVNYYYAFLGLIPLSTGTIPLFLIFLAGQFVLYFEQNMLYQSILLSGLLVIYFTYSLLWKRELPVQTK